MVTDSFRKNQNRESRSTRLESAQEGLGGPDTSTYTCIDSICSRRRERESRRRDRLRIACKTRPSVFGQAFYRRGREVRIQRPGVQFGTRARILTKRRVEKGRICKKPKFLTLYKLMVGVPFLLRHWIGA